MKEYSVVGKIVDTVNIYDDEGMIVNELRYIDGWYVNMPYEYPDVAQYEVFPEEPQRVYSGAETFFYKFDSEEQWLSIVAEWEKEIVEILPSEVPEVVEE